MRLSKDHEGLLTLGNKDYQVQIEVLYKGTASGGNM
jgi:hypothetical protein